MLLAGLLTQLGARPSNFGETTAREAAYFPAIAAAALGILRQCADDSMPDLVIDAVLRIAEHRHSGRRAREATADLGPEIRRTWPRRRAAFWRAAKQLRGHQILQGGPLETPWEMEILGWPPGLTAGDVEWLLHDTSVRSLGSERRLAINAVLDVWKREGSDAALLARIEAAATADPVLHQAYHAWMQPRQPSAQHVEASRRLEEIQQRNAIHQAAHDQSWIDFIAGLRANPAQLRQLRPPSAEGIDGRLFHLWKLLQAADQPGGRYAIDTVKPLEPMLGAELAAAVAEAVIAHWRVWRPKLKSARDRDERNLITTADCIGLAGVSIEAAQSPDWAQRLDFEEARLAAAYATLEIGGGFPPWLTTLAKAKPAEVLDTLMGELETELGYLEPEPHGLVLQDFEYSDASLAVLVAPRLLEQIERRPGLSPILIAPALDLIRRGLPAQQHSRFVRLALDRFHVASDFGIAALYVGAVFFIDPAKATDALFAKLDRLTDEDQAALVQHVLPGIFGDHFSRGGIDLQLLPFECLDRIVHLAFRTVRLVDDNRRPPGVVYSPNYRDRAEGARGGAFNHLVKRPGRATYDAVLRFAATPGFPIPRSRLLALAYDRAAEDSESAPWLPSDLLRFEQEFETAPRTAADLQRVALGRLSDIQHDLLHSDFAQGAVVAALPNEDAVQKWVADRLRLHQGRSFSVEREVEVVERKEPDIRLRGKASDASMPIEVKVPESWTLTQLEQALTNQLCGQYLRAREARHGILLLVHQKQRPQGWQSDDGSYIGIDEVIRHLRAMASQLSAAGSDAPVPEIAIIDVSDAVGIQSEKKSAGQPSSPQRRKAITNAS